MRVNAIRLVAALGCAALLVGCGQQSQGTSGPKADQKSSVAADNAYLEKTFTSGDKGSWEKALKDRAVGQNDYVRSKSL
jgi:hypothetical protein